MIPSPQFDEDSDVTAPHAVARREPGTSSVSSENTIATRLRPVVQSALQAIEAADHLAITLVNGNEPFIATSTKAQQLELAQRSDLEGPTVHSLHNGEVARVITISAGPWPVFRELCRNHGIGSVAAFPIPRSGASGTHPVADADADADADAELIGVLTVYSSDHHAFGATELRIGKAVAHEAGRILGAESVAAREAWPMTSPEPPAPNS